MKKAGKRILAAGVTLGIICGIGGAAFAANIPEKINNVKVNGYSVSCLSKLSSDERTASASTTYNGSGAVSVSSTFKSIYIPTRKVTTQKRTKGNYGTASVSFNRPANDLAKRIESDHSVSASNQTWKGKTRKLAWLDRTAG